jgi:hypothetical protein
MDAALEELVGTLRRREDEADGGEGGGELDDPGKPPLAAVVPPLTAVVPSLATGLGAWLRSRWGLGRRR